MKNAIFAASMLIATQATAKVPAQAPAADPAIAALVDRQSEAWNRNDAHAWSAEFTDDAIFINVRGDLVTGRPGIEKLHAFIFSGPYKGSKCLSTIEHVTYPAPGVAVVDTIAEITDFHGLPPGLVATAPNLLRARLKLILVQRDGAWKIFSAQNTAILPQPMAVK